MRIEGTVALVTGGASGLGRATAEGLVAAGARVVLADLASSDGVAVADALGDAARFVPTDVTSEDDVARALASLPTGQREAVVLVEWLGMDQEDAAAALGIRPGSVRARLSRAKADLRRMLEDEDA